MQQPSSADADDADRKAKLLSLLDRARVNRGLQPEHRSGQDDVMEVKSPPIKTELLTDIKTEQCSTPHPPVQQTLSDSRCRIHNESSALPASGRRQQSLNGSSTVSRAVSGSHDAAVSSVSSRNHSSTNAETSGTSFLDSTRVQTAGEDARQNDKDTLAIHIEASAEHPRVAILSSTPKPRIADLTGGSREKVPRLQQLKPLEVPRNQTHQLQPAREDGHSVQRDVPTRAQSQQPRKNPPPTNPSRSLKKLELLTPDEYDDSELHGGFQHMLHILIPSNATTALLERRGQPIQHISQQADCTLSIREPEASPFKDDRLLRLSGKAKGISLAQRLVIAYIRAYRAEKRDPNYMDLSDEAPPVALPVTSITKALSVAVACRKKKELEITSPYNWMIEREEVGKMMGRQGSILAAIRRDTGAAIHLDQDVVPGTTERRVVLIGSVNSIAAAIEEIKSRSGGHPEVSASATSGSSRLGQYFAIPYHAAGYLIGPQGSTVKSITERTGARLQLPSAEDLPLGSVNRILHIQGTSKQAEHARRVVGAKLRDYLASPKRLRTVTASSTGCKGDKVTIKVLLPSRICGFMLDNRGKLICEISEKSGAFTHFLAPYDDESRVCVFTGDMSSVLRAQRLVLQVIAGDAISSKRVAQPRKRKRSQRYDEVEDEEEYGRVPEEDEYMDSYIEEDVERDDYEEEYEEAPTQLVRRHTIRRSRPRLDYDEIEDMYRYDDGRNEVEYEERPRQLIRRRPIATRPRQYIEDEDCEDEYGFNDGQNDYDRAGYDHNEYDHEALVSYDAPRPRPRVSHRPTVVRQQSLTRRQDEYQEYDEYSYDSEDEYERSLAVRKQLVNRRAIGSRIDTRRPQVVLPGRKVQMIASRSSPRPTDRRSASARTYSRDGGVSTRHNVSRRGRGNARPSASRGRSNGNKRRRQ